MGVMGISVCITGIVVPVTTKTIVNSTYPLEWAGIAKQSFLKELIAKPFQKFTFKCSSVSVYHLGDFGTARKKLWTSIIN